MRRIGLLAVFISVVGLPASADTLRPPLEKQFFDFFRAQCVVGLEAEAISMNMDPTQENVAASIAGYCACTAQAVVSHLTAEEIISFGVNPEKEPAAGKMRPYFEQCHGKSATVTP